MAGEEKGNREDVVGSSNVIGVWRNGGGNQEKDGQKGRKGHWRLSHSEKRQKKNQKKKTRARKGAGGESQHQKNSMARISRLLAQGD